MRVQNNPRNSGVSRTMQSRSRGEKPLTLADYEKMLASQQAQRQVKVNHGYPTKFHDALIAQYTAKIAELGGAK